MDQRGALLTPLAEVDDLRPLVAGSAEVLTVCLPLRPSNEEQANEARLEWRALRERAERAGAPPEALAAVEAAIDGAHRASAGVHVVVPPGGRPHVESLERPPARGSVSWAPVPALVPLLADRQQDPPHVVVLVDRQGADIVASTGRRPPLPADTTGIARVSGTTGSLGAADGAGATGTTGTTDTDDAGEGGSGIAAGRAASGTTTTTVDGDTYPLRKVAPGGWSQRRFQQRAEETWQRNMGEVADEVTVRAEQVGARVVAVGGDERAVHLLVEHLPVALRDRVRPLSVTRATDGSAARLADEVESVLDAWLHAEIARTADTHREELGQGDRAVAGPDATLAALRAARVAQLIVVGGATGANGVTDGADGATGGAIGGAGEREAEWEPAAAGPAWRGARPADVALSRDDLLDPEQGRPVPLVDAAVAAALATGADVRIVPVDPADPEPPPDLADLARLPRGLGAILRW